MYRTQAVVPPNPTDPPKQISLAEQCRQLSIAAQKRIEEEKHRAFLDPSLDKKAKKLYARVLKDIKDESDRGKRTLFWSNSSVFIFSKWTVTLPMAIALCNLLKKDGFNCHEVEDSGDPGQYYISIDW